MVEQNQSPQDQANWSNLLEQFNESYASAPEVQRWSPPPGEFIYSALLTTVRTGVVKREDETTYPYWALTGTMLDGVDPGIPDPKNKGKSYEGRTVSLAFLSCSTERSKGQLKREARRFAGGEAVPQLQVADSIITNAAGQFVIRFKVAPGKREGSSGFVNFVEVIPCPPDDAVAGAEG